MASLPQQGLALYDYDAHESDEVTFREGDRFQVVKTYDDGWWKVNINGKVGMVPSNYLELDVDKNSKPLLKFKESLLPSPKKQTEAIPDSQSNVLVEAKSPEKVLITKKSQSSLSNSRSSSVSNFRSGVEQARLSTADSKTPPLDGSGSHLPSPIPPMSPQRKSSANINDLTYEAQSPELKRLKDLREQATAQLDALRSTVTQYEMQDTGSNRPSSTIPPNILKSDSKKNGLKDNQIARVNSNEEIPNHQQLASSPSFKMKKNKSEDALRLKQQNLSTSHNSHSKISTIPQVKLDPSSIDFISKVINDKINKEFASRDKKLLDQVKQIVQESLAHFERKKPPVLQSKSSDHQQHYPPVERNTPVIEYEHDDHSVHSSTSAHRHSADNLKRGKDHQSSIAKDNPTKIPRIKLPKIQAPQENLSARSENSKHQPLSINNHPQGNGGMLPPLSQNKNRLLENNKGNNSKFKEDKVSEEGVQYSYCRSVVYPSSSDLDMIKQRNQRGDSSPPKLQLSHVLGYHGDPNRHGNAVVGKNVLFISDAHIVYPAAAVVVILDLTTNRQTFFMGHTDDVTCLCKHPKSTFLASAQIGAESNMVYVWEYTNLINSQNSVNAIYKPNHELRIPSNTRGIINLSYSGDGEFLLACGLEDSKSVYIFDWRKEVSLVHAKTGQVDVSKFLFNPYSFSTFQDEDKTNEMKYASGIKAKDAPLTLPGCYTLVSYGGKQVKFWTLKQEIEYNHDNDNGNGGRDYRGKKFRESFVKYVLDGSVAGNGKKSNNAPEYSSCCFVRSQSSTQQGIAYLGTMAGSIYIWQAVEDGESWAARGKLLLVVSEVHEHPLVELEIYQRNKKSMILSADNRGIINLWSIKIEQSSSSNIPLEHYGGIKVDESYARGLCFHQRGDSAVVGMANNSLAILNITAQNTMELSKLIACHNGKVKRLAVHPSVSNLFASVSTDRSIRIWDGDSSRLLCTIYVDFVPSAISFSADGLMLVMGTEAGALVVLGSTKWEELLQMVHINGNQVDDLVEEFAIIPWEILENRLVINTSGNVKKAKKCEITEIRYSPAGNIIAIGCKDSLIHLLSASSNYKHLGACRGHTSQVRNVDFSEDGKYLRSCDASRELLFWEVESCQRFTQTTVYRNLNWNTHSCIYGWGMQGIYNKLEGGKVQAPDGEVNCVSRKGKVLIAAGSSILRSSIKAFDYPALGNAVPNQYGGHSSPVLDLVFVDTHRGSRLVSGGGNDCCIFLWDMAQ